MSDSELLDALDDKHDQNREQRLQSIKHWVQFIKNNPPDVWGPQQNKLIDSQLQSARDSNLDVEHYKRIEQAGRDE